MFPNYPGHSAQKNDYIAADVAWQRLGQLPAGPESSSVLSSSHVGPLNSPHSLPTPPKALPGWLSRWRPWLQADMVPQALPRRSPLLPYPHIRDLHKYSPFMNAQIQANLSWFKIFTFCRSLHPSHHSPPSMSSLILVSYISVSLLPGYEANALFHDTRILPGSSNV